MLDDLLKMSWEEFGNTWTIQALNRRSQLIQWKFDRTPILPPFDGELREKIYGSGVLLAQENSMGKKTNGSRKHDV